MDVLAPLEAGREIKRHILFVASSLRLIDGEPHLSSQNSLIRYFKM